MINQMDFEHADFWECLMTDYDRMCSSFIEDCEIVKSKLKEIIENLCTGNMNFNESIPVKLIVFADGEKGEADPGQECKQGEMKKSEQHKEDKNMKKSTLLESLIINMANSRLEIAIGNQSELKLYKAIRKLRSVVQDAVNSEVFSDEKGSLMDLLGDIHNLQMRDITRESFGKHLDEYLNHFLAKLKELKEEEEKEAFKNKLLENIDLLYEMHKRINQE